MATAIAGFRTRIPAVDADNLLALLFGNPFQDLQELSERQIVNLASPQSLHPLEVKRLKAQHVKPLCQVNGKLPEPVRTTIRYVFMPPCQIQPSPLSISRTLLFAGQLPRSFFDLIERLLQELGRFNLGAIGAGEERFQPKIKASDSTRLDFDHGFRAVNHYDHKQLSQRSPLNGYGFDRSLNLSTVPILIDSTANLDAVAAQELIACLLQRERFILSDLLKAGWSNSFFVVLKKQFVRLLNPLADVLHGLRANRLPELATLTKSCNMSLKLGTVQMLFEHPVVPPMQRNTVIPNHPSSVDLPLQVSVSLVLIKLKLQCFHVTIVHYKPVQNYEDTIRFSIGRLGARSP